MKKSIIVLIVIALVSLGAYFYLAKPCFAGICIGQCINSSICTRGCICAKDYPEPMGRCMSYD